MWRHGAASVHNVGVGIGDRFVVCGKGSHRKKSWVYRAVVKDSVYNFKLVNGWVFGSVFFEIILTEAKLGKSHFKAECFY